jgi:hypothetical protein
MKRFLFLISLLLIIVQTSAQEAVRINSLFHPEVGEKVKYKLLLQFKEHGFTGVCIIKQGEGGLIGSIINEFGIKAFDFVYKPDSNKIRLFNVIGFMDKWYIKRVIKADWKYLFSYLETKKKDKKRKITISEGGDVVLENLNYQIRYTFTPLLTVKTRM